MKICVPIKEKNPKKALNYAEKALIQADLVEFWLDQWPIKDLSFLSQKILKKAIFTYKRPRETGGFKGNYAQLADALIEVTKYKPAYLDIPFNTPLLMNKKIVQEAHKNEARIIVSHHDYKRTPHLKTLKKWALAMHKRSADVVKIATMATSPDDIVKMVALAHHLKTLKIPHCLIAMGDLGKLTRVLTPTLGGEMMFAVLDKNRQTALGQLTVEELKRGWKLLNSY